MVYVERCIPGGGLGLIGVVGVGAASPHRIPRLAMLHLGSYCTRGLQCISCLFLFPFRFSFSFRFFFFSFVAACRQAFESNNRSMNGTVRRLLLPRFPAYF